MEKKINTDQEEKIEILKYGQKVNKNNIFDILESTSKSKVFQVDNKVRRILISKSKRKRKSDVDQKLKNTENSIIDVQNVSKYYLTNSNVTKVLDNISFNLKEGEFSLILGKSGSGKSTLLNLISGLDRPSKGNVIVCDTNLPYLSNMQLTYFRRKHISFIFQNYNLLTNLNGYDNVETGAYLQKDPDKKVDIHALFKKFELEDVMYKYPSQMSGGQQQRISILRALSKNAEIIFADEPTGALDEDTTKIVLRFLYEANKENKTTIVMVTHNPLLVPMADKIIHIENGKISKTTTNKNTIHPDKINLHLDN